jgi:AcrR family transcriptional regulator
MADMAGLRETQKEMTRRLLLTTALQLFESKGYAATTVDDIAAAAGTTRVTFYAYFPSRRDLMRAVIGELNQELERITSPTHGSTERALVDVVGEGAPEKITEWLRTTSNRWDAIRPYTSAAFEPATIDPELRTLLDTWCDEAISDIEEGLDQAGRFAPESRHLRGVLAMSQLDYVARNWTPGRWNSDQAQVVQVLAESWIGLLCGDGEADS